jgi:hypothetical protein
MELKKIFAPHLNRFVVFGRKRPIAHSPRMKVGSYLKALPTPPTSFSYSSKAASALSQMYLNDTLGDCVIAGGYHIVGTETGNAGSIFVATSAQITKDYSAIGGYVPGKANTDNGCDESTALNYWQSHGFANGTKLLGSLTVNPGNKTEIENTIYLFENVMFGIELPDAWVTPFPSASGFVWDVAGVSNPQNGHCVIGLGYSSQGVIIDSWGMLGTITWAAVSKYCAASVGGELFTSITPDQLAKGQSAAPNGVAWTTLISDFDSLGGNVPVPAPTPPTPTPPVPTPTTYTQTITVTSSSPITVKVV